MNQFCTFLKVLDAESPDDGLSVYSSLQLDPGGVLAASWPRWGFTWKRPVNKPKNFLCPSQEETAPPPPPQHREPLSDSLQKRTLSAALCSECRWRMTSVFFWFVLRSGSAMISVIVRLFLMALEAVERATMGRISWYFWSVKSDSGSCASLMLRKENPKD